MKYKTIISPKPTPMPDISNKKEDKYITASRKLNNERMEIFIGGCFSIFILFIIIILICNFCK